MLVVFVITVITMIIGGNGEGRWDMLELTKDQDVTLRNESYNLAFSLKFQAAPEETSCLSLSKLLDINGYRFYELHISHQRSIFKLFSEKSSESFSYCSGTIRRRIEQFTTWARSHGPSSQIAFSFSKKKF